MLGCTGVIKGKEKHSKKKKFKNSNKATKNMGKQ